MSDERPVERQTPSDMPAPAGMQPAPTNAMAIVSLVFGILGFVILPVIGQVLALVFGYVARGQINRADPPEAGRSMATAAIVLGWVGLLLIALLALFVAGLFGLATEVIQMDNGVIIEGTP